MSMTQLQGRPRNLLLGLSVCAFVVITALFGGYAFIRSDSGSQFLIAEAQKLAARQGIQLTIASGRIDPFRGVHFKALKVSKPGLDLSVDAIDIDYQFSIFPRALEVEHFAIAHPILKIVGPLAALTDSGAREKLAEPVKKPRSDFDLAGLVRSPPARIEVRQFSVEAFDADIALTEPAARAQLRGAATRGSFEWIPSRLSFSGEFAVPGASGIAFDQGDLKFSLARASAAGHAQVAVYRAAQSWSYDLAPSGLRGEISGLEFSQGVGLNLTLASANLDSDAVAGARTSELFRLDPNSVQKLESHAKFALGALHVRQAARTIAIPAQKTDFSLTMADTIELGFGFSADRIAVDPPPSPALTHPVHFSLEAQSKIGRDFAHAEVTNVGKLDGRILYKKSFHADTGKDRITAAGSAELLPDAALAAELLPPALRQQIGAIRGTMEYSGRLQGAFSSLLSGVEELGRAPLNAELDAKLIQIGATAHLPVRIQPLNMKMSLARAGTGSPLQLKLTAEAPELRSDRFRNPKIPLKLAFDGNGRYTSAPSRLEFSGDLRVQNDDVLSFQSQTEQPGARKIHSIAKVHFATSDTPTKAGWLTAEEAKSVGHWIGDSDVEIDFDGAQSLLKTATSAKITQQPEPGAGASPLVLAEPIVADGKVQVDLAHTRADGEVHATVPTLEIPKFGKVADTHFSADVHSPAGGDLEFQAEMSQGAITLSPLVTVRAPPLGGLNFKASGAVRAGGVFTLSHLEGEFDRSVVQFTAQGSGQGKDAQGRGSFSLQVPADFPRIAGQQVHGRVDFPWTLSLLHGREIIFQGESRVQNLSWSFNSPTIGNLGVQGITGLVPISEKWLWNGKRLSFTDLITRNPFERVDFERLRPMLDSESQFRIEQLTWDERHYGPFIGFFSIKQNMIIAPQFDLDMGRDSGHVYGEMFFDAYPADLQFGLLSRATGINLAEILPRRYLVKMPGGDKTLSGRSGLVVDFNKGTVDGRVDVTEIGSSQLLLLINVLDPKYEDEKMNKARAALSVGTPTFVALAFNDGYLDMDMNLMLEGIPGSFDIHGIPVSPFISSATADLVKKTEEEPIE